VLARGVGAAAALLGCTTQELGPDTIDPGPDFNVAEIIFDEGFFYCKVEPALFQSRCGPGDPAKGDATNGCHFNVTSFRLTDYAPLTGQGCGGGVVPGTAPTDEARANYQRAQANMDIDPERAPLLLRPTAAALHPRKVFEASSPEAAVIRQWATQFSSQ
jgi:hypothetical protein